jgi:hypothetical protein
MAKAPRSAKAFAGRWRIVEMDNRYSSFLDRVEEAQVRATSILSHLPLINHCSPDEGLHSNGASVADCSCSKFSPAIISIATRPAGVTSMTAI